MSQATCPAWSAIVWLHQKKASWLVWSSCNRSLEEQRSLLSRPTQKTLYTCTPVHTHAHVCTRMHTHAPSCTCPQCLQRPISTSTLLIPCASFQDPPLPYCSFQTTVTLTWQTYFNFWVMMLYMSWFSPMFCLWVGFPQCSGPTVFQYFLPS